MDRRRLIPPLVLLAVPFLVWGAIRLAPDDDPKSGAARELPQPARPMLAAPGDSLPIPASVPSDVRELMRQGRNWRAARRLREMVGAGSSPDLVLTAARAEAGWGGWSGVRSLLDGKPWLDTAGGGVGWYLLGRARAEAGQWDAAADAYARYLRAAANTPPEAGRTVAELRHATALLRAGQVDAGEQALERMRGAVPEASGWISVLAAETLAPRGDTARVRALVQQDGRPVEPAIRAARAHVAAHAAARDPRGARATALAYRGQAPTPEALAELTVAAAKAALEVGDTAAARRELPAALRDPAPAAAVDAAWLVTQLGRAEPATHLLVAAVYERHGNRARAADAYRSFLASSAGTPQQRLDARLKLGNALFAAGRYAEVETAVSPLMSGGAPAAAAEASFLVGRATYRRGGRQAAVTSFLRTADRFRGQPFAGEALYLAADLTDDAGEEARAAALYRRVANEYPGSAPAGRALMRLGGRAFLARDYAGAGRAWEEYRTNTPKGDLWLQATYWAGRAADARGDREAARARWREAREREPLSYYAVKSAERLGERWWPIPFAQAPAADAEVARRIAGWMRALDLLRLAGLEAEAGEEIARRVREAGDDAAVLYPLAEALHERGYAPQAIRVGLAVRRAGRAYDARLVRILYPFPYREMVSAEARDRGLDPFLVAALIRQESSFMARARSGAGAMGLMQVMPATGAGLAAGAGIRGWERDLLFNPEINVHLGTRFLAAQVRSYGGDLPNVFIAYNAGPGRAARWRSFPEARDRELFTERIPFEETRDYVKILTRNREIYRGLYGASSSGDD